MGGVGVVVVDVDGGDVVEGEEVGVDNLCGANPRDTDQNSRGPPICFFDGLIPCCGGVGVVVVDVDGGDVVEGE